MQSTLRKLVCVCVATALSCVAVSSPAQQVPAEFRNDRIFVVARPAEGAPLTFYTDSGGGYNAITESAAKRLALKQIGSLAIGGNDRPTRPLVEFPAVMKAAGVPAPIAESSYQGGLVTLPDEQLTPWGDGFLGNRWFGGHVWEIDYVAKSMKLLAKAAPRDSTHRVPLGFQTNAAGQRTINFARLTMKVDNDEFDMLFDTGATATLTDTAAKLFGHEGGANIATSFIAQSTFDLWASRHPEWRVVPAADRLQGRTLPMIEVPRVSIAGLVVGPVWFTQRPDSAFRQYMSSMMDKPIEGGLGGSAFRYFRITIDYPGAAAYFEIPSSSR